MSFITDRRWLHADERGSVIAVSNSSGTSMGINSYDEYGIPASTNLGRFQYTGQAWLPELGMYYYKARIYSPTLGRFMQTDPIGYADGLNWYNYVDSDPINATDPSGLDQCDRQGVGNCIQVTARSSTKTSSNIKKNPYYAPNEYVFNQMGRPRFKPYKQLAIPQPQQKVCNVGFSPLGDALQDLAPIVSGVGLAATFLGAPEVGLPMLGVGGAMDLAGSYLKDRATGRAVGLSTMGKMATMAGTSAPVAKGVLKAAAVVATGLGMGVDKAMNELQESGCGQSQ